MQRTKKPSKSLRRAELLLLEAQRDVLEGRIGALEKMPQRNLKRDPPVATQSKDTKRPKHEVTMSVEEMFNHCRKLMTQLKKNSNSGPFLMPVDPIALNCPDYFKIVKKPMDFKTITAKLRPAKRVYRSPLEFRDDVRQVFKNCSLYNPVGNQIRIMGDRLSECFESLWAKSNVERIYLKRQDALKRGREGRQDGGRAKKLRTCSPEQCLTKLSGIQAKMHELMSNAADKMSMMEIDTEVPLTFWQKRKLNAKLEGASGSMMEGVRQALPQTDEQTEMVIDEMGDQSAKGLWTSLASRVSPFDPTGEEQAAQSVPIKTDSAVAAVKPESSTKGEILDPAPQDVVVKVEPAAEGDADVTETVTKEDLDKQVEPAVEPAVEAAVTSGPVEEKKNSPVDGSQVAQKEGIKIEEDAAKEFGVAEDDGKAKETPVEVKPVVQEMTTDDVDKTTDETPKNATGDASSEKAEPEKTEKAEDADKDAADTIVQSHVE